MSQENTFIKKDAIIKIEVGAGFLQKLQQIVISMMDELTDEQVEKFDKEISNPNNFSQPVFDNIYSLIILIKNIEAAAEKQGLTYKASIELDSLAPQSPEQPE